MRREPSSYLGADLEFRDLEGGVCLACSKSSQEASGAGAE